MNPIEIAVIERNAEKRERLKIAQSIRLLAAQGRRQAEHEGKSPNACDVLDLLANEIEAGRI